MYNEKAMEYAMQEVYRKIIMQHLFLETLDDNLGDEYIKTKYRIEPKKIRACYAKIPNKKKEEIENQLKEAITTGKISLEQSAVEWHKESLKPNMNGEER